MGTDDLFPSHKMSFKTCTKTNDQIIVSTFINKLFSPPSFLPSHVDGHNMHFVHFRSGRGDTATVAYRRSVQATRYTDVNFLQLFSRYKRGQLGGGYTVFIPRTSRRRPVRKHIYI